MHFIPRFFTHSDKLKGMDSSQKRKGPKLERRNALKNVDYDATTSSPSPSPSPSEVLSPLRTRSLDVIIPFHERTSFRLEGIDGEIDIICQNLGLTPEDFVIPAAAWEARKIRSSSDLLPRSRLSKLNKFKVDTHTSPQLDDGGASEFPDIFADSLRISDSNQGQSESVECNDCELSDRLEHSVRVRVSNENQSEFPKSVRRGGGGINGVRPPLLAPPPSISLPAIDNAGTTWDLLRSFGPDGDRSSSFVIDDRELTSDDDDDDEEVEEEIVKREDVSGARLRGTAVLSESCSCSFTTTSNDDDSSSTTTEATSNISPNFRFRRPITYWEKGDLLGRGTFGSVYEGIAEDGFFFAVKEVSLLDQGVQARQSIFQLEQEIALLSQFEHENIVQYYGTSKDDSKLYIFLELAKVSLLSLYQKYTLRDSQVSAYTRQILHGLKYLHERDVVHRDIKCANILVDANGSVKLADFGLAKATKFNDVKSCKGTACWMAPEVVKSQGYGLAADMWSLGCTVLEMLTGQIPYSHLESPMQAIYRIGKGEPPPVPDSLSEDARDFIFKCLQNIPSARPTAAQLLNHPFVKRPLPTYSGSASPHNPGRLA